MKVTHTITDKTQNSYQKHTLYQIIFSMCKSYSLSLPGNNPFMLEMILLLCIIDLNLELYRSRTKGRKEILYSIRIHFVMQMQKVFAVGHRSSRNGSRGSRNVVASCQMALMLTFDFLVVYFSISSPLFQLVFLLLFL